MYRCESWTIKKAECWRIDAFELWGWRILLRVPWTGRRSNQSIIMEINLEYSLEGLMLKLKLQYFVHLMWRVISLEKTLMQGKTEGKKRRGWQRKSQLDGIMFNGCDFEPIPGDGEGQRNLAYCSPWGHKELDLTEWLNNNSWKLCNIIYFLSMAFISNTFHNQGQMDNYWIIKDVSSLIWTRFLQSVNTSKRHIRIRASWMAFSPTAI